MAQQFNSWSEVLGALSTTSVNLRDLEKDGVNRNLSTVDSLVGTFGGFLSAAQFVADKLKQSGLAQKFGNAGLITNVLAFD